MARYVLSFCLFAACFAHASMPTDDACITEVWTRPYTYLWMESCLATVLDKTTENKETYVLPSIVLNWGSNGLLGTAWHFTDPACDVFIKSLFETISLANEGIHLTPHDLFHAHLINYQHEGAESLAFVFHAKEYPFSLAGIKNFYRPMEEEFDVNDEEFQRRNYVFLSHLSTLFRVSATGACADLFSGANYLSEEKVAQVLPNGRGIGDVNYFHADKLNRIKFQFFKGFPSYLSTDTDDLEGMLTGKSVINRKMLNKEFDQFLDSVRTPAFLYFLTGVNQF